MAHLLIVAFSPSMLSPSMFSRGSPFLILMAGNFGRNYLLAISDGRLKTSKSHELQAKRFCFDKTSAESLQVCLLGLHFCFAAVERTPLKDGGVVGANQGLPHYLPG